MPSFFGQLLVADAAVLGHAGGHSLPHLFVLACIHQAQLPVAVGLVDHRIQQLGQEGQGGVVQGHHNADQGALGLGFGLADQQFHRSQPCGPEGLTGEVLLVIAAVLAALAQTGQALLTQLGQQHEQGEAVPQSAPPC